MGQFESEPGWTLKHPPQRSMSIGTVTQVMARRDEKRPPKTLNQASAKKLLIAHDWTETLGGKHNVKMEKPGHRPITLPRHKGADYGSGLRAAILRQAGITTERD